MNHENQTLESHGVRIAGSMTTPSRPGKKPRPVWVASGNTFGLETFFREIGGKKFRGAWSFFKDPSAKILDELSTNGRQSYADHVESTNERKEAKIERYEGYSENAEDRAKASYDRTHAISSMIPMGQPVLVNHHSEGRHRRDLKRIDNGMRKSIEDSKKAEHYDWKAKSLSYHSRSREPRVHGKPNRRSTERAERSQALGRGVSGKKQPRRPAPAHSPGSRETRLLEKTPGRTRK